MNYRSLVAEKQNILDQHMYIFQSFINNFNVVNNTDDVYRGYIINVIDNLDSAIFNAYKSIMELKASEDFGIQPKTSTQQYNRPI